MLPTSRLLTPFLVLTAALAAVPLPSLAEPVCQLGKLAELPLRFATANMQPAIDASINGKPVTLLFDTGATNTFLHRRGVEKLGLRIQKNGGIARGAGGQTRISTAHVNSFAIGPAAVRDFYMQVLDETQVSPEIGGMLGVDLSLHDDLEIDLGHAVIRTFRPEGCATTALGYWSEDVLQARLLRNPTHAYDRRPFVEVELNGRKTLALVDTGATSSIVRRAFAEQAGFDTRSVKPAGVVGGIGTERMRYWIGRFSFKLAAEDVANAVFTVVEENSSGFEQPDVVLGQDWLRAHRVLISPEQQVFYFSYEGGQPFGHADGQPWFAELARNGHADAQYALGLWSLRHGDAAAGASWLRKAADAGHPQGSFRVGSEMAMQQQYAPALPYLKTAAANLPLDGWPQLLLYAAQRNVEGEAAARAALATSPLAGAERWPGPLLDFYLGRLSLDALRASAGEDPVHRCDVETYLGVWYAAHQDAAAEAAQRERFAAACKRPSRALE